MPLPGRSKPPSALRVTLRNDPLPSTVSPGSRVIRPLQRKTVPLWLQLPLQGGNVEALRLFCKIYVAADAWADMNNALTNQTIRIILLHRHFNLTAGTHRAAAALADADTSSPADGYPHGLPRRHRPYPCGPDRRRQAAGKPESHCAAQHWGGNKSRIRKRKASASSSSATAGAPSRCSSYWWGSRQMTAGKPAGKVANQVSSPCQPVSLVM